MDAAVLQFTVHNVAVDPELVGALVLAKFGHVHISKVVVEVDLVDAKWVFERQRTSFGLEREVDEELRHVLLRKVVDPIFEVCARQVFSALWNLCKALLETNFVDELFSIVQFSHAKPVETWEIWLRVSDLWRKFRNEAELPTLFVVMMYGHSSAVMLVVFHTLES